MDQVVSWVPARAESRPRLGYLAWGQGWRRGDPLVSRVQTRLEVDTLGMWGSKLAEEAAQSHFWVCHGVSMGQELQSSGPNCLVRNQKDPRDHNY